MSSMSWAEVKAELDKPVKRPVALYWALRRRVRDVRRLPREIRWVAQRARRGWSASDAWSFDHHLAAVIAGGVGQLRSNLHGYPTEFEQLDDPKGDKACEAWAAVLDKIVKGFDMYARECFDPAADMAEFEEAFDLFRKYYRHLWD